MQIVIYLDKNEIMSLLLRQKQNKEREIYVKRRTSDTLKGNDQNVLHAVPGASQRNRFFARVQHGLVPP